MGIIAKQFSDESGYELDSCDESSGVRHYDEMGMQPVPLPLTLAEKQEDVKDSSINNSIDEIHDTPSEMNGEHPQRKRTQDVYKASYKDRWVVILVVNY